jgi:membrane-associated protein
MGVILHAEFQSYVTTLNDGSAPNFAMGHWLTEHLNYFFAHYGYWTIFFGVMLESAGIPLPGETILVLASIVAANRQEMNIFWIAGVAMAAAILGDNLGFAAGRYGGCRLLERYSSTLHIRKASINRGELLMEKYGGLTVFFARFIALLRFLAGPLAGVLRMEWRRFLLFNVLGAVAWVSVVCTLAYIFGDEFESFIDHASWVLAVVAAAVAWYVWRKFREQTAEG